jgi:L-lactate dehydrogenase complex protein LldF
VAETGTIINVENEGNIRYVKSSPRIQVSIMSLEKVVPTMADAMHQLRVLCRCCTGQKLAAYISMDSGPKKADETDGPEALYIVMVDNGRTAVYNDPKARAALQCIRCGTCLMACPVYAKVGGYAYGWAYSGPMGQILAPGLLGLDKTADLTRACSSCGECKRVCPAGIDHPAIFRHYRSREVAAAAGAEDKLLPWLKSRFFDLWAMGGSRAFLWNLGVKPARFLLNLRARKDKIRKIGGPFKNWVRERDLPAMPGKTFHEEWKEKASGRKS